MTQSSYTLSLFLESMMPILILQKERRFVVPYFLWMNKKKCLTWKSMLYCTDLCRLRVYSLINSKGIYRIKSVKRREQKIYILILKVDLKETSRTERFHCCRNIQQELQFFAPIAACTTLFVYYWVKSVCWQNRVDPRQKSLFHDKTVSTFPRHFCIGETFVCTLAALLEQKLHTRPVVRSQPLPHLPEDWCTYRHLARTVR